jgi:hypothetical protein
MRSAVDGRAMNSLKRLQRPHSSRQQWSAALIEHRCTAREKRGFWRK